MTHADSSQPVRTQESRRVASDPENEPHQYFTIGEVAVAVGIPKHTIRLWENRIGSLSPVRLNGVRYYTHTDVDLLRRIYRLIYIEGKSTAEAQSLIDGPSQPSTRTDQTVPSPPQNPSEPLTLISIPSNVQHQLSRLIREGLDLRARLDLD